MLKSVLLFLAALLVTAPPALAQAAPQPQKPATGAIAPAPALTARIDQLVALFDGKGDYADLFSAEFRQAVPQAQFQTYVDQLKAQGGAVTGVEAVAPASPWAAQVKVGYERLVATIEIAVDPAGAHRVTGLRITGAGPRDDSVAKLEADFRALPGASGFGIYRLGPTGVTPITEFKGETPAPLGSAFKLWVLAEAARQVAAGERHWDDIVRLDGRSLPSGILQKWPERAPVTLQTLATLMISISDNTAADTLLTTLGRTRVGALVKAIGVANPARTLPLLTTHEAFALKLPANAALAKGWASASPDARRALLADNAARLAAPIDPLRFGDTPVAIDSVEWFASPRDMARTLNWLRLHGDDTTRAILAVNPGVSAAAADRFDYLGFKGGSEAGVITLNFLARTKDGAWLAIAGNWSNPDAAVDTPTFVMLMNRALALAAG